jgi:nicotinate-nucleotide adenylyltransferase
MQQGSNKIGILGGTFNPVHYGHLITAEAVRGKYCLEKVLFIPAGIPPHKQHSDVIEAEHRFNMVKCAISSNQYFEALHMEIDRIGFTYTIDTLTSLKAFYGESSSLYFIVGADVIPELVLWKDYTKVFGLCEFIALSRPGYDKKAFFDEIDSLSSSYRVSINITDAPQIDISSTGIRERVRDGRSIRYLVPQCVEEYIYGHNLYKGKT